MKSWTLPWPPTVNTYYRNVRGRTLISKNGREYREGVCARIRGIGLRYFDGRLRVHIVANPPDHRKRDLDNLLKGLLDALQHAEVYESDSQIDELTILRGAHEPPDGSVLVTVAPIGASPQ